MMTVNLGTVAQATAVTILAPSLAIPPCSYFLPTMKPVMFCRNTSGMRRCSQSSMKCAPLSADSENRMPEVFREAIREAKGATAPIRLLVKNQDFYQIYSVDYHGGLQYPHLRRIETRPDYLDQIISPLK